MIQHVHHMVNTFTLLPCNTQILSDSLWVRNQIFKWNIKTRVSNGQQAIITIDHYIACIGRRQRNTSEDTLKTIYL